MKSLILFMVSFSLVFGSPVIDSPTKQIIWSDFFGINFQNEFFNVTVAQSQISLIKGLGIEWVRAGFHWAYLESTEGNLRFDLYDPVMNLIGSNGLKSIVTLVGTPDWCSSYNSSTAGNVPMSDTYPPSNNTRFAETMIILSNRYPFVNFWEVWNEQNLVPGFFSPVYSYQLYNDIFQATKTLFSKAGKLSQLAVGGLGYYGYAGTGENMVADLISTKTFEGVLASYHPYTDLPEGGNGQLPSNPYAHVATARYVNSQLSIQGKASQVWCTEYGWSNTGQVTTTIQAEYTIKRLLIDTLVNFDKTFLFTTSDLDGKASSIRDQGYGLVDLMLNKKPVFYSLRNLFSITGSKVDAVSSNEFNSYITSSDLGDDLVGIFFKKTSTNTTLFAFWSPSQSVKSLNLNLFNVSGNLYQVSANNTKFLSAKITSNVISLNVTENVQIFEWPIKDTSSTTPQTSSDVSLSFKLSLNYSLVITLLCSVFFFFF
ncbi:hypothetical protein RB653_005841 [Dictyostelium firmibasis]|uniref:Glycoside hydrolase family 5 domain-containing protein n=1 Tax=Dictyostelium firmibasis TaxID=79012 RepID=A0AAN7UC67_9MYCE